MSSVSLSHSISQNLSSLKATQSLMDDTEYKLTTGKKVNSAIDDPVAYFTAQSHQQESSDLSTLKDNMSESIQTIKAADNGISSLQDLISSAKSLAKSALTATSASDQSDLVNQFNDVLTQIDNMAGDSGYGDVNLLGGTSETLDVIFSTNGDSKITVTGFDGSTTGLSLDTVTSGAWDSTDSNGDYVANKDAINKVISALDDATNTLRTKSKTLSSQLDIITSRQDFTSSMITTLDDGSANLVNCNTTEEGANLTTLETQQSLGVKSLSIANSSSQAVLSLFS